MLFFFKCVERILSDGYIYYVGFITILFCFRQKLLNQIGIQVLYWSVVIAFWVFFGVKIYKTKYKNGYQFYFITDNEKLRNTNKTYATNFDFTIVIGCIES